MAKVIPGPVISKVQGSVGPVTYYTLLGQQVVRARVRPHQKISSGRYWARQFFKDTMALWYFKKRFTALSWLDDAAGVMHGVNRFVQQNHPLGDVLSCVWPTHNAPFPPVSVCKVDHGPTWWYYFSWPPAGYPDYYSMLFHADADANHNLTVSSEEISVGTYIASVPKPLEPSWFIALTALNPDFPQADQRQIQRTLYADIPLCP